MNPGMKMMMVSRQNRNGQSRPGGEMRNGGYGNMTMGYGGMNEMESRRRRDSRGRFRSEMEMGGMENEMEMRRGGSGGRNEMEMGYGGMEMRRGGGRGNSGSRSEMEDRYVRSEMGMDSRSGYGQEEMRGYPYRPFPVYERGGDGVNQIGFRTGSEMNNNYRMEANMPRGNEMEYQTSDKMQGHSQSHSPKLTKEMAEEWMRGLKNEDGTKGPHWTMEQTRQVMAQKGIQCDPIKFWAAMNASYSDLSAIAKKHNVSNMDFFTDYAIAFWIKDKDAVDDKLAAYYEYVAKK